LRAFDLLGFPHRLIRPGDRVLLKPNMLSAKEPERAVTTHPEIIAALGEFILDCRGKIVLGDSPAGSAKNLQKYWDKTGIADAARRLGVQPVCFEESGVRHFPAPEGHVSISRAALDVDLIINLPKLKTHQLMRFTGAVKNMFGTVPGFRKGDLHARAPQPLRFARFVLSVYRQVVPALNIMDAVVAMEGNGPSSGLPRHVGALLVSADAFDLDRWSSHLIGLDHTKSPIFQAAQEMGLWNDTIPPGPTCGDDARELSVPNFKMPDVSRLERIPPIVYRNLKRLIWIRPRADAHRCSSCGICVESCPERAMVMKNSIPKINYALCIKCGCCDEVCPDRAIVQEMSRLARLLS
jgi:uncharacterized protein (DUF362 family)/Pyruvate/2-oxoacid:ferredoxin oxidoreductase delta subunit